MAEQAVITVVAWCGIPAGLASVAALVTGLACYARAGRNEQEQENRS